MYTLPSQQPSQSDYGTDGVEYFIKDGDDYYSMYYRSAKVYSYIPQGVIKSSADTPFVRIPSTEDGGLGCYYKVGENDLTYIKRTVNENFITITATNNNLPKTLYDIIKNYRVLGKELSMISLNDVVSNWSYGYSICTPKDFYVRKFTQFVASNTSDTPYYYAIDIDSYGNTIKSALNSNMSSVHTLFPYHGSIGGYTGSYVVMDASLYYIIQGAISFTNGIAVQVDTSTPYIKLTDKTMQLWYQIIESYAGIANQPYVYMYFIPEYYRFRYLYTTDVDKYYVLKEYVDKDFGIIDPWECDSLTSNFVANNPAKALTNMWKPLQDNCSVTLRQNDLYTLTEGDTITLTSKVASNVITWPTFSNVESILNSTNYDTSYTKSNNEIVYLDNISIDGAEWRAYSNLLVNTSTGKGQQLAPNHKITFYDRDANELNVIPDDLEDYDSNSITMFQLETPINNKAGDYIQAFTYDDLGNEVLNNAYIYKQLLSSTNEIYDVTYSSDNTTHVVIHDSSEHAHLNFKFPQGKYLLPLQGVEDSETTIKIKKVTTGYSPTIDTTIDTSKIYYELTVTECTDLTEFADDTDYYKVGISSFDEDDDGYGLSKDDTPKTGVTYYTIVATEYDTETSTATVSDLYEVDTGIVFIETATDFATGLSLFNDNKSYYIYVDNQDGLVQELDISVASPLTLIFGNLFKYENVYEDFIHNELLNKIKAFDVDGIFNYTYQPADNELIENPVLPKSFWDKNHVYNAYTIAQLDTSSTDNINYRFITSK